MKGITRKSRPFQTHSYLVQLGVNFMKEMRLRYNSYKETRSLTNLVTRTQEVDLGGLCVRPRDLSSAFNLVTRFLERSSSCCTCDKL